MDIPPHVTAFCKSSKKTRKETFAEAIADAAVTIKKAFSTNDPTKSGASGVTAGISPDKTIEFHMKNLEKLRYLQQLFHDGILNEKEFAEQKNNVLSSLRKL